MVSTRFSVKKVFEPRHPFLVQDITLFEFGDNQTHYFNLNVPFLAEVLMGRQLPGGLWVFFFLT